VTTAWAIGLALAGLAACVFVAYARAGANRRPIRRPANGGDAEWRRESGADTRGSGLVTSWTGAAEQLAASAYELGDDIAGLAAAAWSARLLPAAMRSLIQAAVALTAGDAAASVMAPAEPCATAQEYLSGAEDLEGEAAALGRHAARMREACEQARNQASAEYSAAQHQAAGEGEQAEAAQQRMREASAVMGDCDAALELIAQVLERLAYAADRCRRVPEDFTEAYDVPLEFIAAGGVLPLNGDFITAGTPGTIMDGA
jgi:hypothetical protein